jgi:hypothetical protein
LENERNNPMKYLLLTAAVCLSLTGCYTMLYPPMNYVAPGYAVTVPDSLAGRGVTIINQNQIIFDRYYQDPYYMRDGFFGGAGCWDPYYYNPYRYHHDYYWNRQWYPSDNSPGNTAPKPLTPRREKDVRRSDAQPEVTPRPTDTVAVQPSGSDSPAVRIEPAKPAPPEPKKAPEAQPAAPDDNKRTMRAVPAPNTPEPEKQADTPKDQPNDKPRRDSTRDR